MSDPSRLLELLSRWEQSREKGQLLTPEQLAPDDPALARALGEHIQVMSTTKNRTVQAAGSTWKTIAPTATQPDEGQAAPGDLLLQTGLEQLRLHGRGGIGVVYVATDRELHRDVAVKFLRERPDETEEFRSELVREAEVTGKLEHPGVVPVYGLGRREDGRPFYVMRFIQGESLEAAIARYHKPTSNESVGQRNLEFRNLLNRFVSVCYTMAYAHNRGIIHRDIKPENVMLGRYSETLLVDWGLAMPVDRDQQARASGEKTLMVRSVSQSGNSGNSPVGTPAYMSPEQADATGPLTPSTDVYSLGATLYKLLTGEIPCKSHNVLEMLRRVKAGDVPPPRKVKPSVPAALEAVCMKAMALHPQDRYASPLELASDVEHWLADEPVSVAAETRVNKLMRWVRRHRGVALSTVGGVLAALCVAVVFAILLGSSANRERSAHEASMRLAAKFAARMMATEMDLRWRTLEAEATDPALIKALTDVNQLNAAADPKDDNRAKWEPLQVWLDRQYLANQKATKSSSWFVLDRFGTLVALVGGNPERNWKSLGKNFLLRDFYHGQGKELDAKTDPATVSPISSANLSTVFQSKTDQKLKVAFSVPIKKSRERGSETIGVLVMTVDVGSFSALQTQLGQNQMAVLVDTRADRLEGGEAGGLILHHKQIGQSADATNQTRRTPAAQLEKLLKLKASRLRTEAADEGDAAATQTDGVDESYQDPILPNERWTAVFEPVFVKGRSDAARDTGWVVIVQGKR